VTGVPINMLVAVTGSGIAAWLSRNRLFDRMRDWLAGLVLIGLGVRLALSERR